MFGLFSKRNKVVTAGDIRDCIIIGPSSSLTGVVRADKVSVFGRISFGMIYCGQLTIYPGGSVSGIVYSDILDVKDGGILDASCFISPGDKLKAGENECMLEIAIKNTLQRFKTPLVSLPAGALFSVNQENENQEPVSVTEATAKVNNVRNISILGDIENQSYNFIESMKS